MKFDIYSINKYAISSDTDSIFITAEPLLIKKYGVDYNKTVSRDDIIKTIKEISLRFEDKINKFMDLKTKELLNVNNNKIGFKTETIIESAYWSGKRRYAQHIIDKEGISVDEWDFKGLDIMKSNFPVYFKEFGESMIKNICLGHSKNEIDKSILEFKQNLNKVEWKKLLKPTGLKKLEEYISSPPSKGQIFSKIGLKCPINTKGCIFYNDLLTYLNLDSKYSKFTKGDKVFLAYLKPNKYNLEVIGFNGYNDPEEITELIKNHLDREKLFDSIIKNKIETVYDDLKWGKPVFNSKINKFFIF